MSVEMIIFLIIAVATLGSALMVVTTKNLVHMALWLIVVLLGIAIFFAMLSAGFLAVAQVVIYIGAIAILLIFAIMLTQRTTQEAGSSFNSNWRWGILVSLILFAGLFIILVNWSGISTTPPNLDSRASVADIGVALVEPNAFLLPFEFASVLLLAALIGAIYVAWDRRKV